MDRPARSGRTAPRAVVLWSGGKDSALALDRACEEGLQVDALVTFAPPREEFRAHPLPVLAEQAAALGLPSRVLTIEPPFERSYRHALQRIARDGITHVVTGDIDVVAGQPNWIRQCAMGTALEVLTPLWGASRDALIDEISSRGFRVLISCVRPPLPATLCGQILDESALDAIRASGADLCGENGEYHTLVIDAPAFSWPLRLEGEPVSGQDGLVAINVRDVRRGPSK